jgi:hypothetical protein
LKANTHSQIILASGILFVLLLLFRPAPAIENVVKKCPALLFINLERLDALDRLGHGLAPQEVLEQLEALLRTVEGDLVPRASDRHQRQALVHLAPSTNLQAISKNQPHHCRHGTVKLAKGLSV